MTAGAREIRKVGVLVAALCACPQTEQKRPRPVQRAADRPLFALKVEDRRDKVRYYLTVRREGAAYTVQQVNTLAVADKDAPTFASSRARATRRLSLDPGEVILRTAAFTELAMQRPNRLDFIGSMHAADSTTRIFGTTKDEVSPAALADKGKLHLFAFLESGKRGLLYGFTIDTRTDRASEVRVNDERTFRRVNAVHAARRAREGGAPVKDLYLALLQKLQGGASQPAEEDSAGAHCSCPACGKRTLALTRTLELAPDGYSDEISLQTIECHSCGLRGVASYEESRHGSRERVHHLGGRLGAADFGRVVRALSKCPTPRNRRCKCAAHGRFNQVEKHSWRGLRMFDIVGETFALSCR